LTCKNRWLYNLYCVGADVKPCSINQCGIKAFVVMLVACQLYESIDIVYQHHTVDVTDSV